MSSVRLTKFVLASAFASLVLFGSSPSSAYTEDTTAWYVIKWKLLYECRIETAFSYNLYPLGHEKWNSGWRQFHPVNKRRKALREVTSRINPTPYEVGVLAEHDAICQEWLVAARESIKKKACKQLRKLGLDMDLPIVAASRPVEKLTIFDNTHPPTNHEVGSEFSYYNQRYGWTETTTLNTARDCNTN